MSAVKEANNFLAPVFNKEQLLSFNEISLILRLSKPLTRSTNKKVVAPLVITHALELLLRIHQEICVRDSKPVTNRLERPGERRTVFALLDLLVLEGIYPSLSPGVGIPIERRARSFVLPQRMTTPMPTTRVQEVGAYRDVELLEKVVDGLIGVLSSEGRVSGDRDIPKNWKSPRCYKGIEGMVRERCLVDLIAGCGELAMSPETCDEKKAAAWKEKLSNLMEGIQTGALLPLLMSLLHPASPPWFRQPITKYLSQLPVSRPHGVRSILELFLSTASSGNTANSASAQLSVEALSKASRLISSVPTSMNPQAYFSNVCPQLLEILRGTDPGMERAAAYVIAELLGKKGQGVEDTVQTEVVCKIVSSFDPSITAPPPSRSVQPAKPKAEEKKSSSELLAFEDEPTPTSKPSRSPLIFEVMDESDTTMATEATEEAKQGPLVSDVELSMAFRNLEVLLASHPTPLLPQRLISPILIPLWGLMGYAKSISRSAWHNRAAGILKSYLTVSLDQGVLEKIQGGLTFTGGADWEYAPGSSGGIEIRSTTITHKGGVSMELINSRVEEFMGILGDESVPSEVLNDYSLSILRTWMARSNEEEPLKMLINVKVLQEVLQVHGEALAKKPTEILQIIKSVLDEYVGYLEALKRPRTAGIITPRLSELGKIVQDTPEAEDESDESQRTETVAMALTLLSVLISSPETKLSQTDERLVTTLHPSLHYLSSVKDVDPNITSLAVNISSLLLLHAPAAETISTTTTPTSVAEQQREKYTTALSYLRDPLIPVRAHGLYLLRELILDRAPIVDVTNTARLLITMLKDGDSFVYLNVVKCLAALTDRHSMTVARMLVAAYVNDEDVLNLQEKLGLDERLRIGEALLWTVQRLGRALVGDVAEVVAQGMFAVISRRRKNTNPPPPPPPREDGSEMELDIDPDTGARLTPQQLQAREHAARIVAGWTETPHEDLRIRTSALSVLGTAAQTNATGLGARVVDEVVDTALAILTQETSAESGILRRAAVVAVSGVLNGVVRVDEEDMEGSAWKGVVWDVVKRRVKEIRRVLGYVRATDADGLVRQQAGVVEENLQAVVERGLVGGRAVVENLGGARIFGGGGGGSVGGGGGGGGIQML